MEAKEKVSIIIPVYNAEAYLPETLDSIASQDYPNFEVLLVDDGSTDRSGEICDAYSQKDPRFRVFHKANGGVSSARNDALDHITGEYCMFIDSDDLVKPDYIKTLVNAAVEYDAEIAICRHIEGDATTQQEFETHPTALDPQITILSRYDFKFTNDYRHSTVWGGVYRTDLIGTLRFVSDLYVGEDTYFFAQLLSRAETLAFVDEQYYYYRYRTDSLAHSEYNARQSTEITTWERVCALFENAPGDFYNECKTALALRCRKNYFNAALSDFDDQELIDSFHSKGKRLMKYVLRSDEQTLRQKLSYMAFVFFPKVMLYRARKRLK